MSNANIKKLFSILLTIAMLPLVHASTLEDAGSITTDSIFYSWDVGLDNVMVKLHLKNANDVAKERLAELEVAKNTDDYEGIEKANEGLKDIEDDVEDETIKKDIEKENEDIKNEANFTEQDLITAINSYSKIDELGANISQVGVETEGLKDTKYIVTFRDNRVTAITEVSELPDDIGTIDVSFSEILLSLKNQEYREKKLDELLKLKNLQEDGQGLFDRLKGKSEERGKY